MVQVCEPICELQAAVRNYQVANFENLKEHDDRLLEECSLTRARVFLPLPAPLEMT